MADIIASSPVARTINLTRSIVPGSIFGARPGASVLPQTPLVQPREKLIDPNEVSLRRISNQLTSLTAQMVDIGGALERIAFYIAQDTSLDNLKIQQEKTQEKQLTEEGIRTRQESIIERKIKSALLAPVEAIAQRTQSVLGRLMEFFGTLLGGWLLMRGIDTLKSLSEGNTKKLEEIRDSILKNLGIAAATLFVVNGGFFALIGTIGSITLKIAAALGKFLFIKPFQFISKLIGDAVKNIVKPAATTAASATAAATKPVGGFLSSMRSGLGKIAKGTLGVVSKVATPIVGIFDFSQRMGEGQNLFQAAVGTGGSLAASAGGAKLGAIGGSFFGPVGTLVGGVVGGATGFMLGGMGVDLLTGVNKPKITKTIIGGGVEMTPSEPAKQTQETSKLQSKSQNQPASTTVIINEKGEPVTVGKQYPAILEGKPGTVMYDASGKKIFTPSTPTQTQGLSPLTPSASQFSFNEKGELMMSGASPATFYSMMNNQSVVDTSSTTAQAQVATPTTPLISSPGSTTVIINERGEPVTVGKQYPATLEGKSGAVTYDASGKKTFTPSTAEQSASASPVVTSTTQPQIPITPTVEQYQFNVDTFGKTGASFGEKQENQSSPQPSMYADVKISAESMTGIPSISPPQAQVAPLPVAQMQQRTQQLTTPLSEPKPTVVMARTSSKQQGGMSNQPPPVGGPANNVPAISSSNPENFYTLYSQVNYNVVV